MNKMKYDVGLQNLLNEIDNKYLMMPEYFGVDDDDTSDVYGISWVESLDIDIPYDNGISKLVFLPEDINYVIKIPFNGSGEVISHCEWDYEQRCYIYEDGYNEDSEEDIAWEYYDIDYCEEEVAVYKKAVEAGFGFFFAKVEKYDSIHPIYIQEKVNHFGMNSVSKESKERAKAFTETKRKHGMPYEFIATMLDYYGENKTNDILDYLDKEGISDLHSGNIGYALDDNRPIVFDYSGF